MHRLDGVDQVLPLHRLEQVAAGTARQGQGQVVGVFADGQHQHLGRRLQGQQLRQGVDAVHAGQVVVQQHDVGLVLGGVAQGFTRIGGLGHHGDALVAGQQGHQATAEEGVVIDHEQADGHGVSGEAGEGVNL